MYNNMNQLCVMLPWGAQIVKNPPAMQETWIQSLGREDPREKGMSTHFRILAWRIPWTEEPGGLQSIESQRVGHNFESHTHTHTHTKTIGDGISEVNWLN